MFIHKSRLEPLLMPSAYYSQEQYELEVERMFKPGWQLLATKADLPKNGDFITTELFGQPILLRNFDGDYRCFLNVCAHRHALLSSKPRGNEPQLKCQYHGWEYNKDGRTGRIPDAGCFRPWDRENAHLHTVRTETCGDLIFVTFAEGGPDLEEYLGPYHEVFRTSFVSPYRQAWSSDATYAANWKAFIEVTLESYHVPSVHPTSLKNMPKEKACEHELNERYTWFKTEDRSLSFLGFWMRSFGKPLTCSYEHHTLHPNINYSVSDGLMTIMTVLPASRNTCRHRAYLYTLRGENPGPINAVIGWAMARAVGLFVNKVNEEDMTLIPKVQRGIEASPYRGVIGTREERIYAFQRYIVKACGGHTDDQLDVPAPGPSVDEPEMITRQAAE